MKRPPKFDLKALFSPISADLGRVDAIIRDRLASEVALIDQIGAHIISAGGKRMRPAILLLVARALGCKTDEAPELAAVIEFIHTATLLHDDVVDTANQRRGIKTANAVWGNAGAVLSGDFLYSRSFQMMVDTNRMETLKVLANATNAIAQGEVLQLMNRGDPEVSEQRYLRVIELKTAKLFEAAAQLGAIAADQPEPVQKAMARYGQSLGLAYQITDDLLDYKADPLESGKSIGIDLAEGKPTLPLIHAMLNGTPQESEKIRTAIRDGRLDWISEVLAAVERTGGLTYSAALAESHTESAISALGDLPDSPHKDALTGLARFAIERTH